jgi:hypothetical protein
VYAVFVFQSFHRLSFQQNSVIDNRLLFGFFCNIFAQMTAENDAPSNDEQKAKKRKERLEQNRISARESRKRKKTMIEELQRTVITLSRENKELNDTNASLRKQLVELASKYPNVVNMQGIMPQPPPATTTSSNTEAAAAATTAAEATAAMAQAPPAAAATTPAPAPQATAFPGGMFFFPQAAQWAAAAANPAALMEQQQQAVANMVQQQQQQQQQAQMETQAAAPQAEKASEPAEAAESVYQTEL